MYCLDSDVLIEFLRGNRTVREKCLSCEAGTLFTTFVNVCELYKGAYIGEQLEKNVAEIEELLHSIRPLNMSDASCIFFGKEWVRLRKAGTSTQDLDLMVASVATTNNLILVTRNKKHYINIHNLTLEQW